MSMILECRSGDEIVCIDAFHASPEGESFSWDTSRRFQIGERLRYIGSTQQPHFRDQPNAWLVRFDTVDGKCYAAAQTYFVTEECWQGLEKFFREHIPLSCAK